MANKRGTDDPKVAAAVRWLCDVTGIQFPSRLAVAIGLPPNWGTRRMRGSRPEPDGLALIYLASGGHEVFKPQDDREQAALTKIEKKMPAELQDFIRQYGEQIKASQVTPTMEKPSETPRSASLFNVIPSPLADAIVAGTAEIQGQVLDANRFALTRENFALIGTKLTPAEVEDTVALANELTRRLRILMQMDPEHRKKVLGGLGISLNSLQGALMAMKETSPDAMIRRLNQALTGQEGEKK